MSNWLSRYRGKFVKKGSMEAVKLCDRSGFWFSESDICVEKEWRGNSLVPTGFFVGRPYLDEPNEQFRTPKISDDPQPVPNARPMTNGDLLGPDVPPTNVILASLNNFDYTKPTSLPNGASKPNLPNLGGQDVSNISADRRLNMLHKISGAGS